MSLEKRSGYIKKFLNRADKAIDSAIMQGTKRADDILNDAAELGKITMAEAQKKSNMIKKQAKKESKKLKLQGEKKITKGIEAAKKITTSKGDTLDILAKLGELKKAGIITDKEFKDKKKKLLKRI